MPAKKKIHRHAHAVKKLHARKQQARDSLLTRFPHVERKLQDLNFVLADLRRHSAKVISSAALASGLLVGSPAIDATAFPAPPIHEEHPLSDDQLAGALKHRLGSLLPQQVGPLKPETEAQVSSVIRETLGIDATAELEGHHLNTSYGFMGAEQHLPRYPGDTVDQHDAIQKSGITPARGAFGYFVPSKDRLTQEDIMREKYYVAVQTLYLPDWNTNHAKLKPWYKFRKVLVVNSKNGKSVVAVVGDAGPAAWTGKHFGGSPEIMAHLELNRGKQKGAVILYFLDEKDRPIALGPVEEKMKSYLAEQIAQ